MLPFLEVLALLHDLCCEYNFAAAIAHINFFFFFFLSWGKQNANPGRMGYKDQKSKALMKNVLPPLNNAFWSTLLPNWSQYRAEVWRGTGWELQICEAALRQQKLALVGAPMTKKLEVCMWQCEGVHKALGRLAAVERVTHLLEHCIIKWEMFFMSLWPVQKELCWKKLVS